MKIWNSYSNEFTTLDDKPVYDLYVCGVTPYDTAHVGHGATFTYFDTMIYHIEHNLNKKVNYIQNITDIDDSIIAKAKSINEDIFDLARSQTKRLNDSMEQLGLRKPNKMPKVSEKIQEIIETVTILKNNGFLYDLNGDWYFQYSKTKPKMPELPISEIVMERIFNDRGGNTKIKGKEHPLDFIVWQKSLEGEPSFESPLGIGRPGWHIECTSMLLDEFGGEIDIHGGGEDLKFPHHTSEMAQNFGLGNDSVAKIWMHTGTVDFFGEKMSKSLGNMIYIDDLLDRYPSAAIKIAILNNHYFDSFSWHEKLIHGSFTFYKKIQAAIDIQKVERISSSTQARDVILNYLNCDLDTPAALRIISNEVEKVLNKDEISMTADIKELCGLLNLVV